MAIAHLIPIAEAAAFTAGCAVIGSRRIDPQRLETGLSILAVALLLLLLVSVLPGSPTEVWIEPATTGNFMD